MSDDKSETSLESLEGWSIVRHRDDVGSDADSVEVISDDSDRETCDEGKEAYDDEHKTESADSTTNEHIAESSAEEVNGSEEDDLDSDLVKLDPLSDLTTRLSAKLHEFLLAPRQIHNDRSQQQLKLNYVIIASILLALISCLLASSYLLFHKLQELPDKRDDSSSAQVVQELEQAISRLQSVLRLESEQHLKDILSKMPHDYGSLENVAADSGIKRKVLIRSNAISDLKKEDVGVVMSIEDTKELTADRHVNNAEKTFSLSQSGAALHYGAEKSLSQEESDEKTAMDQTRLDENMASIPLNAKTTNDAQDTSNAEIKHTDSSIPAQGFKEDEKFDSHNHVTSPKDSEIKSNTRDILLSVREDILSIQNLLYSQIMNSLFEYKIDLYKNLLRAGLDSTCNADHLNKKSNHKKFMLIRNLQNMIAKSSESNFESWYKFYSYSVSPSFRSIVNKLDSITKKPRGGTKSTVKGGVVIDNVKPQQSATSDDFFVRSSAPHRGTDYETVHPSASDGFDWKNLDKKIKESMDRARNTRKEQMVTKNQEKDSVNVEDEKKRDSSDEPLPENGKLGQNGVNANIVKTGKTQEGGRIHNGEKNFKEHPSARSERSSKEEVRKERDRNGGRKYTNNKNKKSTSKNDSNNNDQNESNKQSKKKQFEKHNSQQSSNFEKSRESGDKFGKEKVKYEQGDRSNSRTKEHLDKDYCSGGRCGKSDGQDYYFREGRPRRKSFLNNMTKYVKRAASGIWKTVRGGFKKVRNYGSYIKDWHTGEDKGKGNYEEWRKEFVKEMKDVFRVLGGNPAINGLYELPKSVTQFFGDGLGNLMDTEREYSEEMDSEGLGPAGMKLDECNTNEGRDKMGSHGTCSPDDSEGEKKDDSASDTDSDSDSDNEDVDKASWYTEAAKHRAKSRGRSDQGATSRPTDPSWFLGLGRHRSYLRRRGIHLDDNGSWFISSARHRAKMRQRHTDSAQSPLQYEQAQASSKR